jgi:hypothetical protein
MSSFQGAHKISNQLAEVLVTSGPLSTPGWLSNGSDMLGSGGPYHLINPQKAVKGMNYRILEIGYTVVRPGTNDGTSGEGLNSFNVGTVEASLYAGDEDAYIALGDIPATPAKADSYSTSVGGSNSLSFVAAGTGNMDSDGGAFLNAGDLLSVEVAANVTNGPVVVFYARLAPIISKDVFV